MLERIIKLYVMAMRGDVRSPMPHLFGPPGCGKSTVVQQLADLLGVNLHIINVSRISPLEVEGVQMPVDMDTDERRLHMLTATFWTQIVANDILLMDEFLRGFPEVYNALLDIFTSRQVAGYKLPPVFIIGASNSTVSYDKALEDRLLHITVEDPRKSKAEFNRQADLLTSALGLLPDMARSSEMHALLNTEVLPMYAMLDGLGKSVATPATGQGYSMRNLIGQAKMREVQSTPLKELLNANNIDAVNKGMWQHLFLFDRKNAQMQTPLAEKKLRQLQGNARLTEIQALNVDLNLELIQLEERRNAKEITDDDDIV